MRSGLSCRNCDAQSGAPLELKQCSGGFSALSSIQFSWGLRTPSDWREAWGPVCWGGFLPGRYSTPADTIRGNKLRLDVVVFELHRKVHLVSLNFTSLYSFNHSASLLVNVIVTTGVWNCHIFKNVARCVDVAVIKKLYDCIHRFCICSLSIQLFTYEINNPHLPLRLDRIFDKLFRAHIRPN